MITHHPGTVHSHCIGNVLYEVLQWDGSCGGNARVVAVGFTSVIVVVGNKNMVAVVVMMSEYGLEIDIDYLELR